MSKHKCRLPSFWIGRYQNRLYLCQTCGRGWTVRPGKHTRPVAGMPGAKGEILEWQRVKSVKGLAS